MSLKDDILARYTTSVRKVEALNGLDVHVRTLSGADWYDLSALEGADRLVRAIILGACDKDGNRVFTDADDAAVRGLSREFTEPVANAILSLSGVGADTGKEPSPPSGGSPSA